MAVDALKAGEGNARSPQVEGSKGVRRSLLPWYPVLIAAFPVIGVYSRNLAMVPLGDVWRPLAVALAAGVLIWILSAALFRSISKGALFAGAFAVLFCSFGPISRFVGIAATELGEAAVLGILIYWLARTRRDLRSLSGGLNAASVVLILLPLSQILIQRPPGHQESYLDASLPVKATAGSVSERPDIFFIIVDGYGRSDQLERVMGYSNKDFVAGLEERGFYVAKGSHSNYCQTQLSLAATLNLSFLQQYPTVFPANSDDRVPLVSGMDKSFIASYLKKLGYTYVGVTSGFNEVRFDSASLRFDRPLQFTMLEDTLLELTPITEGAGPMESRFVDRRKSLTGAFANLAYLGTPTRSPRFIVAHVLAPHPPFVFDAQGRPVTQRKIPFGFWDGSHYMSVGGTHEMYRDGYVGQVQYLNKRVLEFVDQILSKEKTPPVIMIEGDHGSKLHLDQDDIHKTDLREVFGNLMAFHVPARVKRLLYPQITSVNSFRVLLDGLFGENLPILPDESFYSPFSKPYLFTNVTRAVADGPGGSPRFAVPQVQ